MRFRSGEILPGGPRPARWVLVTLGCALMWLIASGFDQDRDLLPDAWEAVVGLSTNVLGSAHLAGWWPMEQTGTNRVDDISGGGLTGWVQGADSPMFPTGLYEGALALGPTGAVRFDPSLVSLGTDGFTFSACVCWPYAAPWKRCRTLLLHLWCGLHIQYFRTANVPMLTAAHELGHLLLNTTCPGASMSIRNLMTEATTEGFNNISIGDSKRLNQAQEEMIHGAARWRSD